MLRRSIKAVWNVYYKTFSIRIKEDLCSRMDEIAAQTGRSRNELVALFIEYGLDNCEIVK